MVNLIIFVENNDVMILDGNTNKDVYLPLFTRDDFYCNELFYPAMILASSIRKEARPRKDSDQYALDVFDLLNRIDNCLGSIYKAKGFISRRPSVKELDDNDQMTITEYYMYHYDMVIHKLSTIRDLSYKLMNVVFRLGIEDKKCGWNSISKEKDRIGIPVIMNLQQLYYIYLERIELERNASTHSGIIDLIFMREVDFNVSVSQMIRLYNIPTDGWDPMTKGSYNERQLSKCKKRLLERIDIYLNRTISFIHILTCCMGRVFHDNLPEELKFEFEKELKNANKRVNEYENKNNKLTDLSGWLIHLDETAKRFSKIKLESGKSLLLYFD